MTESKKKHNRFDLKCNCNQTNNITYCTMFSTILSPAQTYSLIKFTVMWSAGQAPELIDSSPFVTDKNNIVAALQYSNNVTHHQPHPRNCHVCVSKYVCAGVVRRLSR